MDCQEIKKLIPVYLDKELEPQESQQVREHLSGCPSCQKELEAFEESWAMLGELDEVRPEPGFVGRFWTRLALEQSWQERISEAVRNGLFQKRLVPALAMACIVVIVGSFALNNYFRIQNTDQMLSDLSREDLAMVENIELAENLDLIEEMDFLEDLDIIENLDILET
ncbi:MAG: zf-HC2 domain-containing protein [Candidatus Omnitrophica bacterium]|nr:zf-HC2 domain-containing protein [Candidatus Omnitrophota bacterium]MCK5180566.1 zf-HC2 domain-containing protein [Candidatus Omnitrophota bacterium]